VREKSNLYDVYGLRTLLTLGNFKFYRLILVEGFEPVPLDRRVVDKDITTTFFLDKTITLGVVKPFHFSSCHC